MRARFALSILTAWLVGACSSSPSPQTSGGNDAATTGSGGAPTGTGGSPSIDAAGGSAGGQGGDQSGPDLGSAPGPEVNPPVDGPPDVSKEAGPPRDGAAPSSTRVLIYTRTTGQRHDSIPVAADYIGRAAKLAGLTPETSEDTAKFTTAGLAPYGAIILLATTGEPFGPGTVGIDALAAYVKGGGALVGIENATHAYDTSDTYVNILGADFVGHTGGFTTATCTKEGNHPSVAMLPASFNVLDEIYDFTKFRMDNQVVLRCAADHRPISWYREEGAGRIFYTALGHANESWTKPPLVDQHVLPGLLWTMKITP
ncbi:MAG TPA: ThuA domain-containing protein [Polyangia bacterium]|nr:ThuA domain-containing protein [Polyangia bacterium]